VRFGAYGFLALAVASSACHTMRTMSLDELEAARPSQVQVTRSDQSQVVLLSPRVVNNRLTGFSEGRKYQVIAAADVSQILVRQPAHGKTAMVVAVSAVTIGMAAYLLSDNGDYHDPCSQASSECETTLPN
jgi:hypothetical protein